MKGSSSGIPGHCSHGTNNTSLWIGRSSVLNEFVLFPWFVIFGSPTASFTLRTKPSSSSSAFTTRANDQRFRGVSLSLITTTSSTLKFLLGRNHFCHSCKACKNSFLHRVQNSLLRCCTRFQCLRKYISAV